MKLATFSLGLIAMLGLGACTAETDDSSTGSEESSDELVSANFGYYQVLHKDYRKCSFPLCGGYYVKRVNEAKTTCADGSKQEQCYVAEIALTGLKGLSKEEEADFRAALDKGQAVVKARQYKKSSNGSDLGQLKAQEGWKGASGATPEGTFYRAADNGIRCIKAPCPSTSLSTLNSNDSINVIKVNLNTSPAASKDLLEEAGNELTTDTGILLAGGVALPKCVPGSNCGPFASATEFYLPVRHREGQYCGVRGAATCGVGYYCAWDIKDMCGAADAPGVCTPKPKQMMCTMIYDPVCGCDGKTYSNACVARNAAVSISSKGACEN